MTVTYESEFAEAFKPFAAAMAQMPKPRLGNLEDVRGSIHGFYSAMVSQLPEFPSVSHEIHYTTAADGHEVPVWYFFKNKDHVDSSAVYYIHGGGFIDGTVDMLHKQVEARVEATGIPFFAPDYRLAPQHPNPTPLDDSYAGYRWVHENAGKFGVDASRLAVMGESAGGGMAAGIALKARDEKLSPSLAKQILVYPMIDDRNTVPEPSLEHLFSWSHNDNQTAWKALIGDKEGDVDHYCAPARAPSLARLPSTYLDVGTLDIFLYETIEYAQRLLREGVEVELHVWPRVPHGFEGLAPNTRYGKMALNARDDAVRCV